MIKAIIFDMDGVLVDSEAFICQAATAMFAEKGLSVQEADFLPFVGAGEDRYLGGVAQKYGIPFDVVTDKARTYAIYQELIAGALHPLPGVHHFIDACRTHGLKLAVASSADLVKVQANLNEIGLPFTAFDTVVNGLDVEHKKPAPDIFLLAAERLDTPPEDCLVVEDAINGVEAAKASGAHCLGLTTSFTPQQLQQADWTAADLSTIPPELLKTIGL